MTGFGAVARPPVQWRLLHAAMRRTFIRTAIVRGRYEIWVRQTKK
jgi:hypothetical protein